MIAYLPKKFKEGCNFIYMETSHIPITQFT